MKTIRDISRKINSAKELESVVKTMKGLAAVSINQYEHAVDSISGYFSTIEKGVQIVLQSQPQLAQLMSQSDKVEHLQPVFFVFGSGQPLCGTFNEVLATYVHEYSSERSQIPPLIHTVGHRIRTNLRRHDLKTVRSYEMPSTIERINDTVQQLVIAVQQLNERGGSPGLMLFYNHPAANSAFEPTCRQLLPFDANWIKSITSKPWEGNTIPTYSMDSTKLISELTKQLLFVSIYRALASSLSAENNSRLIAMQIAEKKNK